MYTYDLIIKYTDGDSQIVKDVTNHSYEPERGMFGFKKNEFQFFIPKEMLKLSVEQLITPTAYSGGI